MTKLGLAPGRPSEQKTAALKSLSDMKAVMVRVNFELDEVEHLKLKIYAAKSRRSISDILRELIEREIPS